VKSRIEKKSGLNQEEELGEGKRSRRTLKPSGKVVSTVAASEGGGGVSEVVADHMADNIEVSQDEAAVMAVDFAAKAAMVRSLRSHSWVEFYCKRYDTERIV
jgi:hypothetical protein